MRQRAVPSSKSPSRSGLRKLLGLSVLLAGSLSTGDLAAQEPLPTQLPEASPRTSDYKIDVRLGEDGKTISGSIKVLWRNQTDAPTDRLVWHVYNNAWEGTQSMWLQEALRLGEKRLPEEWGRTEVESPRFLRLMDPDGAVLADAATATDLNADLVWEFLPQIGAPDDRTVAQVILPREVLPGHSVEVDLQFTSFMPRAYRRSGWGSEGYLHAVQWYPKLGVLEELDGRVQWNCPPYRYLTEFYSDYSRYEVSVTLPKVYENHFVATGSILGSGPASNKDGSITYFTEADDVHDYAWTVDPEAKIIERDFRSEMYQDDEEEQRVARALGRSVEEVRPGPTRMILLIQPEHEHLAERYFDAMGKSIYYFGLWYGSYPYPTISCVDPANDARWTGGMEYPRLITGGAKLGVHETTLRPQGVTVHEFGHQFWYGLVGNDEFRHAWLDEGFNTFSTQRILNLAYPKQLETYEVLGSEYAGMAPLELPSYGEGDPRAMLGLERWESPDLGFVGSLSVELRKQDPLGSFLAEMPPVTYWPKVTHDKVLDERQKMRVAWGQPLAHPTMDLLDMMQRRINAYYRPAMTLESMARLMGEDRWTRVLRAYHERYRFAHPQPEDFLRTLLEFGSGAGLSGANGVVAIDWAKLWQHAYHGNAEMDFAVHQLSNVPMKADGTESTAPRWNVSFSVTRATEFEVPVEVRVTWEDGSATDLVWAGDDWVWRQDWTEHPQQAIKVEVDPRRRLILDRDWGNNTITREPDADRAWHVGVQTMLWAQQVLQYFGGVG